MSLEVTWHNCPILLEFTLACLELICPLSPLQTEEGGVLHQPMQGRSGAVG